MKFSVFLFIMLMFAGRGFAATVRCEDLNPVFSCTANTIGQSLYVEAPFVRIDATRTARVAFLGGLENIIGDEICRGLGYVRGNLNDYSYPTATITVAYLNADGEVDEIVTTDENARLTRLVSSVTCTR